MPTASDTAPAVWLLEHAPDAPSRPLAAVIEQALDAAERDRLAGFGAATRRLEFTLGHALARLALSTLVPGARPRDWRIRTGEGGRPRVDGAVAPSLSIAHTAGAVAVAVAACGQLGIDIEWAGRQPRALALAGRFFCAEESTDIGSVANDERGARFLRYWTLKEAYLKARGTGLRLPLRSIRFALPPGDAEPWPRASPAADIGVALRPPLDDDPAGWRFRQWRTRAGHLVALAHDGGRAAPLAVMPHQLDIDALAAALAGRG